MSDLYDSLHVTINEALGRIHDCSAEDLLTLKRSAFYVRDQALVTDDKKLLQEADRLAVAIEGEIDDRGGSKYLDDEAADAWLAVKDKTIEKMTTSQLISEAANTKICATSTRSERFKDAAKQIFTRLEAELKNRGVDIKVSAIKMMATPPVMGPVPTPEEIITGKSAKGIPNN